MVVDDSMLKWLLPRYCDQGDLNNNSSYVFVAIVERTGYVMGVRFVRNVECRSPGWRLARRLWSICS